MTTSELERLAAGCLLASFDGPTAPRWMLDRLDHGLGGVVLFASNVRPDPAPAAADRGAALRAAGHATVEALAGLCDRIHDVRPDAVVAIDEEGGDVTRLEAAAGSSSPGNAALGAVDDVALTSAVAAEIGGLLAASGIDLNLAPCVDVNSDPRNPVIGVRSFGTDPALVARHAAAFVRGLQSTGVAACAKHFPGHGHTAVDSHRDLPVVDADRSVLAGRELVPFVAAIEAGVAAVMTAHLVVPALDDRPATLSPAVLTGLLRRELGFTGLIVTDALDMAGVSGTRGIPAAAVRALAAGADLCCLGPTVDEAGVAAVIAAIVHAVRAGDLPGHRLHPVSGDLRPPLSAPLSVPLSPERGCMGIPAARRALRVLKPLPPLHGAHVVELVPAPNIAAGEVPWGLAAPMRALDPTVTSERIGPGDEPHPPPDRPVVLVVRDAARHRWQQALTERHPHAVVVEMGWPGAAPDAHLLTFGASRVSGEAAAQLLLGKVPAHG